MNNKIGFRFHNIKAGAELNYLQPVLISRSRFAKCVKSWKTDETQLQLFTKSGQNKITAYDMNRLGKARWADVMLPLVQKQTKVTTLKCQNHRHSRDILIFACNLHSNVYISLQTEPAELKENIEENADSGNKKLIAWHFLKPKNICNCSKLN